jgi:hypothetical protein
MGLILLVFGSAINRKPRQGFTCFVHHFPPVETECYSQVVPMEQNSIGVFYE